MLLRAPLGGGVSHYALEIREPSSKRSFIPSFTLYKILNRVPWRHLSFALTAVHAKRLVMPVSNCLCSRSFGMTSSFSAWLLACTGLHKPRWG